MPSLPTDLFERFAVQCDVRMTAESVYAAPRDVVNPPAESDQYFLVTLDGPAGEATRLRLIFITPLADPSAPTMRDVLWWLAGDAWALERAHRSLDAWAAAHGYPLSDEATVRLFEFHVRQAAALHELLGSANYQHLLALYDAEVSPPTAVNKP